MSSKLYL